MNKFDLISDYHPTKDQELAIEKLKWGISKGIPYQVLLGVTGSGKTFTVANLIKRLQIPTLVISHNKTLAAQLYQEFKSFFPNNAVSYFVSYYDYYQPEAYIPSTDTYIEKDADINERIDKLRLAATANLVSRNDVITVASVSCIYNIGSPENYIKNSFSINIGDKFDRNKFLEKLTDLQYERSEYEFTRGTFRLRADNIDIYPSYLDFGIRIEADNNHIKSLNFIDPISSSYLEKTKITENIVIFPSKHFIADADIRDTAIKQILSDTKYQVEYLNSKGKILEANRIKQKVNYDLDMIREVGYVKGIENYSRYFDGRKKGEAPFSLLDFYNYKYRKNWLAVIDESHITFPQIRGMFAGDQSRKNTLINYGFRLPSALDNRPLKFDEFLTKIPRFIAVSATPDEWEISLAKKFANKIKVRERYNGITQQLVRPTGIPDPQVLIRPIKSQVSDIINEVKRLSNNGKKTLITTLTKKTAEDLTSYFLEQGIKVNYLHSDVDTLERTNLLDNLRRGVYDVLIGVNLLREGIDLPEVSLVAILDADKEGFLRSKVSLIQTMGRASRNVDGKVILFADTKTKSIISALNEIKRRRIYQLKYNKDNNIIPKSIEKPIRDRLIEEELISENISKTDNIFKLNFESFTPMDKNKMIKVLRKEMKIAADNLDFESAIRLRNKIRELN